MLSRYGGTVEQDSNSTWLHTGGDRQFCESHQRHLSKKDLKHINLMGDVLGFLTALHRLGYKHYVYDRIDPTPRWSRPGAWKRSAASCCTAYAGTTNAAPSPGTGSGTGGGVVPDTHMYQKGTSGAAPDNNGVERVDRMFVAVRSDGVGTAPRGGWTPTPYCSR